MRPRARIIALGQAAAGDDGVGLAVLERLRAEGMPPDVELVRAPEDTALVQLLETRAAVVLVDAVLGAPAGEVLELAPEELAGRGLVPVSTHGLGVARAIELARILSPEGVAATIRIVGVTIARPRRHAARLSPRVAAAVPRAAARVRALVEARHA